MEEKFITNSAGETCQLAKEILKKYKNHHIFLLEGELGSGKTTFVQGIAKELGISGKIQSPTFVLEKRYNIKHKIYNQLIHIDLYRLKTSDWTVRDLAEIFSNKDSLVIVEWSDRLGKYKPNKYLNIAFKYIDKNLRKIKINTSG